MLESRVITSGTFIAPFALSRSRDQDASERQQFDETENEKETIKFGLETTLA